jgi:TctA family transporter
MLLAGVIAYLLEANRFPIAPAILGVVLGGMLEENFITSMIKSNGDPGAFFARPIALGLAVVTLLVWFLPGVMRVARGRRAALPA